MRTDRARHRGTHRPIYHPPSAATTPVNVVTIHYTYHISTISTASHPPISIHHASRQLTIRLQLLENRLETLDGHLLLLVQLLQTVMHFVDLADQLRAVDVLASSLELVLVYLLNITDT